MMRQTYAGRPAQHAWCVDCGWESWAKNAQGNGARHSDAHGHTVHVEVASSYTYTPLGSEYDGLMRRRADAPKEEG